jgi:hypothetical protein
VYPIYPAIPSNTNRRTGRRVLLSGGQNQYKLVVFSVFRALVCDLRVLSLRLHPHRTTKAQGLTPPWVSRSQHLTVWYADGIFSGPITIAQTDPSQVAPMAVLTASSGQMVMVPDQTYPLSVVPSTLV